MPTDLITRIAAGEGDNAEVLRAGIDLFQRARSIRSKYALDWRHDSGFQDIWGVLNELIIRGETVEREYHLIKMVAHAAHHVLDDSDYDEIREASLPGSVDELEAALNAWEAEFPDWHDTMDETRAILRTVETIDV